MNAITRGMVVFQKQSIHSFNINKWKLIELVNNKVSKIKDVLKLGAEPTDHIPKVGDSITLNGRSKKIIGYNGSIHPTKVETESGELFYGNLYVARKYAKKFQQDKGEGFVRAIVAEDLPKDADHGEAWFEGNWQPLKREALQDLFVEAVVVENYKKKS